MLLLLPSLLVYASQIFENQPRGVSWWHPVLIRPAAYWYAEKNVFISIEAQRVPAGAPRARRRQAELIAPFTGGHFGGLALASSPCRRSVACRFVERAEGARI